MWQKARSAAQGWLGFRSALIIALGVAVVGFLLIDGYVPKVGFLWNVMNGEIPLWETCSEPRWGGIPVEPELRLPPGATLL